VETTTDRRRGARRRRFRRHRLPDRRLPPLHRDDFEIPKQYGLRQTIADTLGVGGIMRGLRTVPHLWAVAEDMAASAPTR
jgi:alpha-galactosidase